MTKVFHSALVRPNLECHIQFWILQKNRDMGLVEWAWKRAIKMPKGLEHLSCEERLRAEESVHSWEKAWRGSCQCVQIPGGREYRSQSQTSHWCPVNIWEARGTNGKSATDKWWNTGCPAKLWMESSSSEIFRIRLCLVWSSRWPCFELDDLQRWSLSTIQWFNGVCRFCIVSIGDYTWTEVK